jgi:hypothetical protein
VKKSVIVTILCLGVFASDAYAADVAVKGSLSETFDGSNNYFLSNAPSGTTFRSLSAVNVDAIAQTPDTRMLLNTNFSYYKYFGAGAADTSPTSGTPAATRFQFDHTTELNRYNFAASWQRADVATTQLTESGIVTGHGFFDTFRMGGGITRDISREDSISWSAGGTRTTFTNSTQAPYTDFTTMGAWNHSFSPRTTLTTSVAFDWFSQDDQAKSERVFWQIVTGLRSQLSSRLSFNVAVGATYANSYQRAAVPPAIPPPTVPLQSGVASGMLANVGVTYKLLKNTTVSFSAAESLVPTTLGPLQKITTAGATLSYGINRVSNLSFSTQFARVSEDAFVGGNSDFFSAQVNYGYRLAKEWRTNLSYTYRHRTDVTGSANSSAILVGLVYDFTLLGNPTAFNEAEAARARARSQQAVWQAFPNFQ